MIKAPKWCADAVPSTKGWHHPDSCELLKAQKFTQSQVDEWHCPAPKKEEPEQLVEVVWESEDEE